MVFTVSDEEVAPDSAVLGARLGATLSSGLRVFLDYDTSLNTDTVVHAISGALEYRW